MRKTETHTRKVTEDGETVKEETYEKTVEIECDICGETTQDLGLNRGAQWSIGTHNKDIIAIVREKGASYPEGGWSNYKELDVCPDCWENKIVPLIESEFDVTFNTREETR